jgi:hypothetical protein
VKYLIALSALFLGGCAGQKTITVKVPVSVPCNTPHVDEPVYPRPAEDAGIYERVQIALAEIELRKGYEAKLRAAKSACDAE